MKILTIILILFTFSTHAKDLEIFGINFEKNYNSFFTKTYFNFFIKEREATFLDVAKAMDNSSFICDGWNTVINWETGECSNNDTISKKLSPEEQNRINSILEVLYTKTRIRPYVVNPPIKNKSFYFYVMWVDTKSGTNMGLNAVGLIEDTPLIDSINDKIKKGQARGRLCRETANLWLHKLANKYNVRNKGYNHNDILKFGIKDYGIQITCLGKPVIWIDHRDSEGIFEEEANKLMFNLDYKGFSSDD